MRRVHWGSFLTMLAAATMCGVRPTPLDNVVLTDPTPTSAGAQPVPGSAVTVDWRLLRTLDFQTGKAGDSLRAVVGKKVRVPGFIVPLEDFQDRAKEFLLVPYFGACVHLPPPPPNQLIHTTMRSEQKLSLFAPVWIEGTLEVIRYRSIYGSAGFRIRAERIYPYQETP